MKVAPFVFLLLSFISASNADGYWLPFLESCPKDCMANFLQCAEPCLDRTTCPPKFFNTFSSGCTKGCYLSLKSCWDKCVDETVCEENCLCPKPRETCPGEDIYIENKNCCRPHIPAHLAHLPYEHCAAWYCPMVGGVWECKKQCQIRG